MKYANRIVPYKSCRATSVPPGDTGRGKVVPPGDTGRGKVVPPGDTGRGNVGQQWSNSGPTPPFWTMDDGRTLPLARCRCPHSRPNVETRALPLAPLNNPVLTLEHEPCLLLRSGGGGAAAAQGSDPRRRRRRPGGAPHCIVHRSSIVVVQ